MSTNPKKESPVPAPLDEAALAGIIAGSKPEDYDGHTEFERLSPRARLQWLDSAVSFYEMARRAREARDKLT
jgi:hypothetical protein